MKRLITFTLSVILAIAAVSAQAETGEEMKARFEKVRKECAAQTARELADYNPYFLVREKCRRIDSLRDDLIRCAHERIHLRVAAGCSHQWEDIGPGTRWCRECRSIANFLGGKWMVVFTNGLYVGPDPLLYPDEYNLRGK
jgi:hypothetical protein